MRARVGALLVGALLFIIGLGAWAAEAPKTEVYDITLIDALTRDATADHGAALLLEARRTDGQWERVWGLAGAYCRSIHTGFVTRATADANRMTLEISMEIVGDAWTPGGRANYTITVTKQPDGQWTGTHTGQFNGMTTRGQATVALRPTPKVYPEITPVAAGEHPRLLFRKSDLPALRQRMATPFGQEALKRFTEDGMGLGVLYQLTGEQRYADQARDFIEKLMANKITVPITDGHHQVVQFGWTWEEVAQSYDLCYDGWTPEFRKTVERYMVLWANRITYQLSMFNTQAQWGIGNSESGNVVYGAMLFGLGLWGEKGPAPAKPIAPDPIETLPAAAGYTPGAGVPVVPLQPGKSADKWLATPAVGALINGDPFAAQGGFAQFRPTVGSAFTFEGKAYAFAPLGADFLRPDGAFVLNVGKDIRKSNTKAGPGPSWALDAPLTICFYTVLQNDAPRAVKVNAPFTMWGKSDLFLNGHYLSHGQVVTLEPGLYPMLVVARICAQWDSLTVRLDPATDADVTASKALMTRLQAEYAGDLKEWEFNLADWKRTGGTDVEYQKQFELARYRMYLQEREGCGTGGAQPDHSGTSGARGVGPGRFFRDYRVAFGQDLSPYNDLNYYLPRKIFAHVYPENGAPVTEDIYGPNDWRTMHFPFLFAITPEEWKPIVLWAWNNQVGIKTADDVVKAVQDTGHPMGPMYAFVDYPLTMTAKAPTRENFPLSWEAPDFGYYAFRSGWTGGNDFLIQMNLKSQDGKGYGMPNAGTFRIMGLGHTWADGLPSLRLNNQRIFDPLPMLSADDINEDAYGKLAYLKIDKDAATASLTCDLNDVYGFVKTDAKGRGQSLYEPYGKVRHPWAFQDNGISGLRAYAVDYSGLSGAPCLYVMTDKIAGGKDKLWIWHLPAKQVDPKTGKPITVGDAGDATVDGNTVTVTKADGATMRMTFVAPVKGDIKAETRKVVYTRTYNRGEGTYDLNGIFAQGPTKNEGDFLVVVTIQPQGVPAPAVTVQGEGLNATITVGKRTVRFDGTKLILGEVK